VLSSHLGSSAITAVLYIPLGLILGVLFLKSIPVLNLLQVIIILISGTLAVVISSLLIILIGLFSFVIEDANPIFWIHSKIILILGTLFPVEYFPSFLQPLIIASPIFVTCYGPARLFVNFTGETCASVIIAQIIYVIAIYLLCSLIYRKGVKRINVNGG
jgi:ABC-2 type transport system permease protein